ncbi:uncharacterized protein LOC129592378 [Paramacrobiotus metropolitanus]|uniref:uncharacterized protein LOC129592378 n=1 Tax=Paramacrobiotus metropolitanus TaxID=2943436 RepID=UPI00244570EC|nr:uncharacterized protein LOC129592378 [Paramacrobiotus metropolitanus]
MHMEVMVALRRDSAGSFLFQAGRVVSSGARCPSGLVCVEADADGDPGSARGCFVQPVQLRWGCSKSSREPLLYGLSLVSPSSHPDIHPQVVRLDPGRHPDQLDLPRLLRACSDYKPEWASALRVAMEDRVVRVVFEYHACHVRFPRFPEVLLQELVERSCILPVGGRPRVSIPSDFWMRRLPYELQVAVVRSIQGIHTWANARRVCTAWYDALAGERRHVAIDVWHFQGTEVDEPEPSQPTPKWAQLMHILQHTVDQRTLSLTLTNGSVGAALEAVVYRFLSLNSFRLPEIILRKVICQHPLTANHREQRLDWGRLGCLAKACRTLHLQKVTILSILQPISGLWCSREHVRDDLDVCVGKAAIDCMQPEAGQLRQFLSAVNRSCRAVTPAEWEDISLACDELAVGAEHAFRMPLMLKLLNERPQPPLSRLAAHAFLYSYPLIQSAPVAPQRSPPPAGSSEEVCYYGHSHAVIAARQPHRGHAQSRRRRAHGRRPPDHPEGVWNVNTPGFTARHPSLPFFPLM